MSHNFISQTACCYFTVKYRCLKKLQEMNVWPSELLAVHLCCTRCSLARNKSTGFTITNTRWQQQHCYLPGWAYINVKLDKTFVQNTKWDQKLCVRNQFYKLSHIKRWEGSVTFIRDTVQRTNAQCVWWYNFKIIMFPKELVFKS